MGPGAGGVNAALVDRRLPLAAYDRLATLRRNCGTRVSCQLEEERVQAFEEYLKDAESRIESARTLLIRGDWQRGIFELGCAFARILETVEWLNENIGPRSIVG